MIEVDGPGPCGLHTGCGATTADDCPIEARILAALAPRRRAPAQPTTKTLTPEEEIFADALRQLEAMLAEEPAPLPAAAPAASPAPRPRLASWRHLPSR